MKPIFAESAVKPQANKHISSVHPYVYHGVALYVH